MLVVNDSNAREESFPFVQLSDEGANLRAELKADVQKLAGDIGERNVPRYPALNAAADFIEQAFTAAGLQPRRQTYQVQGKECHNIEAEIKGASSKIILVGAHYDSVFGAPGANDNGSGVAAARACPAVRGQKMRLHAAIRCIR